MEIAIDYRETCDISSVCWRMENNLLAAKTLLDSIVTGKIKLGSCCPYIASVLNFWTELTLVNLTDSTKSQVVTGRYREMIIFPTSFAMERMRELHISFMFNSLSVIIDSC